MTPADCARKAYEYIQTAEGALIFSDKYNPAVQADLGTAWATLGLLLKQCPAMTIPDEDDDTPGEERPAGA